MQTWKKPDEQQRELLRKRGIKLENMVVSVTTQFLTFRDESTGERLILQRYEV